VGEHSVAECKFGHGSSFRVTYDMRQARVLDPGCIAFTLQETELGTVLTVICRFTLTEGLEETNTNARAMVTDR
jgi:hypothetical protein